MGKGSARRPSQIPNERFQQAWDAVFGKKESKSEQRQSRELKKSYEPDEDALNRRTNT